MAGLLGPRSPRGAPPPRVVLAVGVGTPGPRGGQGIRPQDPFTLLKMVKDHQRLLFYEDDVYL